MKSGVLLVDKPRGPTSHDVVARVRKKLGTRRVGHAGTLDPEATGLLVVLVEEATKLAPYLTADDKGYLATVVLGRATDSGDAVGKTTHEASVPREIADELAQIAEIGGRASAPTVAAAIETERARTTQVPPAFSAIHVDGVRSHALARAGVAPELAPRPVFARKMEIRGASPGDAPTIDVELHVSKGYYVRSFARDLGDGLGVPAHLGSLRRTRSGAFSIGEAVLLEEIREEALIDVPDAAVRALPVITLAPDAERLVRFGRLIEAPPEAPVGPIALLDETRKTLIAIAEARDGNLAVLRGFSARVA